MIAPATKRPPRIAVQAFWLVFARVLGTLIIAAVPILLVRVLTKADLGLYRQVFMVSSTVVSFALLGVGMSSYYFLPRYPEKGPQIACNIFVYNLITGSIPFLVLLFYPGILGDFLGLSGLETYAPLLGVLIVLTLCATFLEVIPTALQDVRLSTVIIVGTHVSKAVVFAIAAILFRSVTSLVIAGIAHQLVQNGVMFWYLHRHFGRFWSKFEWPFFKQQIGHAVSFGIFGWVGTLKRDMHNYFVSASVTAAEFAIYSVGSLQVPLSRVLIDSLTAVMIGRVGALRREGKHKEILHLMAKAINRLAAIQFPIAAVLFVIGRDLIVLLYTPAYERSADIFVINVLLLPLGVFVIEPVFRAYGGVRRFLIGVRFTLLVLLAATLYIGIKALGVTGAVIASVVVALLERAALCWRALRVLETTRKDLPLFFDLLKVTAVTAGTTIAAYGVRNLMSPNRLILRIVVTTLVFSVIYLIAMYVFKLPGSEELNKNRLISHWRAFLSKFRLRKRKEQAPERIISGA